MASNQIIVKKIRAIESQHKFSIKKWELVGRVFSSVTQLLDISFEQTKCHHVHNKMLKIYWINHNLIEFKFTEVLVIK